MLHRLWTLCSCGVTSPDIGAQALALCGRLCGLKPQAERPGLPTIPAVPARSHPRSVARPSPTPLRLQLPSLQRAALGRDRTWGLQAVHKSLCTSDGHRRRPRTPHRKRWPGCLWSPEGRQLLPWQLWWWWPPLGLSAEVSRSEQLSPSRARLSGQSRPGQAEAATVQNTR